MKPVLLKKNDAVKKLKCNWCNHAAYLCERHLFTDTFDKKSSMSDVLEELKFWTGFY